MTGKVFSRLTVIKFDEVKTKSKNGGNSYWLCRCECGNIISPTITQLKSGRTKSCGCYSIDEHRKNRKENIYDLTSFEYGVLYINDKEFYFDKEDYNLIKQYYWHENDNGYAINSKSYRNIRLHRLVMHATKNQQVDHINRNRRDNTKENLRICSQHKNTFNSSVRKNSSTKIVGVNSCPNSIKWVARITYNYKSIYLGLYEDITDAIIARLKAEIKYFGKEFAPQRHLFKKYLSEEDLIK